KDDAFACLDAAVARGYNNAEHLQRDDDLKSLRGDARFRDLVKMARKATPPPPRVVEPRLVQDGVALVGESNTVWDARNLILRTLIRFDTNAPAKEIILNHWEEGDLLRKWQKEGTAAGNAGDL